MKDFINFPPIPIRPVTEIVPFTYRDGFTYLSILNQIVEWIRDKIVPKLGEIDDTLAAYITDVNTRIQDIIDELNDALVHLDPERVAQLVADLVPRITQIESNLAAHINEFHTLFINYGDNRIGVENATNIIGELLRVRVSNASGVRINVGTVVSILDSNNIADIPGVITYNGSKPIVGVAATTINNGSTGFVVRTGYVVTDTMAYSDGQLLFAQPNGTVSDNETNFPVATVVKVGNSATGRIFVCPEIDIYNVLSDIDGKLADALSDMHDSIATIQAEISSKQPAHMIDMVADYGADKTGIVACDDKLTSAIERLRYTGGTIYFPSGKYRFNKQISLPGNAIQGSNPDNRPLWCASIRLLGDLGYEIASPATQQSGTIFDMRYKRATTDRKDCAIKLDRWGEVRIENISFINSADSTNATPFIFVGKTTPHFVNLGFSGHTSLWGRTCIQDAIILGHSNSDLFWGYGATFEKITFSYIRVGFDLGPAVNSCSFRDCCWWTSTGSNTGTKSAVVMNPFSDLCVGNVFDNCLFQIEGYDYAFHLSGLSKQNTFINISLWDFDPNGTFKKGFYLATPAVMNNVIGFMPNTHSPQDWLVDNELGNDIGFKDGTVIASGMLQTNGFYASGTSDEDFINTHSNFWVDNLHRFEVPMRYTNPTGNQQGIFNGIDGELALIDNSLHYWISGKWWKVQTV